MQALRRDPLIFSIYLPFFVFALAIGMLVPILPFYAGQFNVSYGWIGLVLAGASIGRLIGDMPAGTLPDRFGTKQSLVMGLSIVLLATVAQFWAQTVLLAMLLQVVAGIGQAIFFVAQHSYIVEVTRNTQLGRVMATYGGVFRIGNLFGPALGGALATLLGVRFVFLIFGALCALSLAILIHFLLIPGRESVISQNRNRQRVLSVLKENYRVLSVAGSAQLLAQITRAGRTVVIPLFAADVLGLDVNAVGIIISASVVFEVLLFYPSGLIMDRWGRKFSTVPCFGIQAVGLALIPFTADFRGLFLAACLIGFGNGIGAGTMMTLGADLAPAQSRPQFLGIWRLIGDSGAMFAPMIVGMIAQTLILRDAPFAIATSGFMASAMFFWLVPETLKKRRR